MTTIVTRAGNASPLTHDQLDANFTNLNFNKLEAGAIALGSAGTPSISFVSDTNTGIFSPGADQVAISTSGVQRLSIGSTGNIDIDSNTVFVDAVNNRVGIGSSSPGTRLDVISTASASTAIARFKSGTSAGDRGVEIASDSNYNVLIQGIRASDNTTGYQLAINPSGGNVGIGTTAPLAPLHVGGNTDTPAIFAGAVSGDAFYKFRQSRGTIASPGDTGGEGVRLSFEKYNGPGSAFASPIAEIYAAGGGSGSDGYLEFLTKPSGGSATPRARIDSSGRLLVGTSTARDLFFSGQATARNQIEGNSTATASLSITRNDGGADGNALILAKARGTAYQILQYLDGTIGDDRLGRISFQGADGTNMIPGAEINAFVDGTPGTNDMPTRLVFSTTPDGSASPTERMTISSAGVVTITVGGASPIVFGGTNATSIFRSGDNGSGVHFTTNAVAPSNEAGALSDNTESLGTGAYRWSVVFAGTGTINTSDLTEKQDVENLNLTEINVASAIKLLIKKYRFKDAVIEKGSDARVHVGVIAQEVEQAFVAEGLDPRHYGMFCEDELEDGRKRLGIRYDELLAFVIAGL